MRVKEIGQSNIGISWNKKIIKHYGIDANNLNKLKQKLFLIATHILNKRNGDRFFKYDPTYDESFPIFVYSYDDGGIKGLKYGLVFYIQYRKYAENKLYITFDTSNIILTQNEIKKFIQKMYSTKWIELTESNILNIFKKM